MTKHDDRRATKDATSESVPEVLSDARDYPEGELRLLISGEPSASPFYSGEPSFADFDITLVPEASPAESADDADAADYSDGTDASPPSDDTDQVGPQTEPIADLIGVVRPGESGGLCHLVCRSLGQGDSGVYDGAVVDVVKGRQADAGLEVDGVVAGETWALVLRDLKPGAMGHEVQILRKLLGLPTAGRFDDEVLDALAGLQSMPIVDTWTWRNLIQLGNL